MQTVILEIPSFFSSDFESACNLMRAKVKILSKEPRGSMVNYTIEYSNDKDLFYLGCDYTISYQGI